MTVLLPEKSVLPVIWEAHATGTDAVLLYQLHQALLPLVSATNDIHYMN
ncbi:hypothetical protein [Endozoicomonas sp. ONNA1]|nr:hypothetical protein [Endozoicomonas sp. ONNA1]